MSRDGNGNYNRVPGSSYPNGTIADGPEIDAEMADIATALTQSLSKDGQTVATANLPMGGYRHTNVDDAAARTDYARADQVQDCVFSTLSSVSGADTITATAALSMAAYVSGQKFSFVSAGANTGAVTLNINGLGAKNVTKRGTTALAASDIASGAVVVVQYDGTQFQIVSGAPDADAVKVTGAQTVAGVKTFSDSPIVPAPTTNFQASTKAYVDAVVRTGVRQTVMSGPVDSGGLPDFGGSTGSTTVTASGTLIVSAANGFGSNGVVDRIGSIANPSFTGLSTNGTMYLYLTVNADGTCTTGVTTLAPVYQEGGVYSATNGQFTFSRVEMVGKVGDGSAANQAYRVYVGQVTVSGSVVTAITWYSLNGRYDSGWFAVAATTAYAKNHNIGVQADQYTVLFSVDSAGTAQRVPLQRGTSSDLGFHISVHSTTTITLNTGTFPGLTTSNTGATSGFYRIVACRGW